MPSFNARNKWVRTLTTLKGVTRLLSGLKREYHDYKPSLHIFPELVPDKIASDMQLEREAGERGKRNEPPLDSTSMDDFELRLVDRVESEKNAAHNTYSEELRVYGERIAGLEFEERFNAIRNAAPAAVSEFKVEVSKGRDELHLLRRNLRIVEMQRDEFMTKHHIRRLSQHSAGGSRTLKIGVLVFLTLVEVVLNGVFLSKSSADGLIGGMGEAFTFAILNVLVSFGVAAAGVRWIVHRNLFAKLVGLFSLIFYLCFAVALNLALAHYREVAGTLTEEAGQQVIERLMTTPLGINDLKSWLFFALGLFFSAVAFGDAFVMFDPYPGFGKLNARVELEHQNYIDAREGRLEELKAILDEAVETMEEAGRDLSRRRGAYDSYMQGRERLNQLFIGYQDHLERTVNTLLFMYREKNVRSRKDGSVPERFRKRYEMVKIPIPTDLGQTMARDDLRKSLAEAQEVLTKQVAAIHAEFHSAVETYKQIDDLIPENDDGTKLKVA